MLQTPKGTREDTTNRSDAPLPPQPLSPAEGTVLNPALLRRRTLAERLARAAETASYGMPSEEIGFSAQNENHPPSGSIPVPSSKEAIPMQTLQTHSQENITESNDEGSDIYEYGATDVATLQRALRNCYRDKSILEKNIKGLKIELDQVYANESNLKQSKVEMKLLRSRLDDLTFQLKEEKEKNIEIENAKCLLDKEYESLSVQLFEQANSLVKEERMLRAHSERKMLKLEAKYIRALQIIQKLKCNQTIEGMEGFEDILEVTSGLVLTKEQEELIREPCHLCDNDTLDSKPSKPDSSRENEICTIIPSFSFASSEEMIKVPFSQSLEFQSFLQILFTQIGSTSGYISLEQRYNALFETKYLVRIFEDDVKPTINLSNLSWFQKKVLAGAIVANRISIVLYKLQSSFEQGHVAAPRILTAKPFFSAMQARMQDECVNHDRLTSLQRTVSVDTETDNFCWGCASATGKYPKGGFAIQLDDDPALKPICPTCRNKILCSSALFSYIRMINEGNLPDRLKNVLMNEHPDVLQQIESRMKQRAPNNDENHSFADSKPLSSKPALPFLKRTASYLSSTLSSYRRNKGSNDELPEWEGKCEEANSPAAEGANKKEGTPEPTKLFESPEEANPLISTEEMQIPAILYHSIWSDLSRLRQGLFFARAGIEVASNVQATNKTLKKPS
jgi:hypothetical protein